MGRIIPIEIRWEDPSKGSKRLRSYQVIARKNHTCDACNQEISPGDEYEGSVWVYRRKRHRIVVWKKHINPGCPFDSEEWEKHHLELDKTEHIEVSMAV